MSDIQTPSIPAKVKRASQFIHASLIVYSAYLIFVELFTEESTFLSQSIGLFLIGAFTLTIMIALAYAVGRGKNWARMVFTVILSLNVMSLYSVLQSNFDLSPVVGAMTITMYGLQILAAVLLFSPGTRRFYRMQSQRVHEE